MLRVREAVYVVEDAGEEEGRVGCHTWNRVQQSRLGVFGDDVTDVMVEPPCGM